jgi:hypothetical protein
MPYVGFDEDGALTAEVAATIAAAAAEALTWINTQGGTELAETYAQDPRFTDVEWQTVGPMLDSVTPYNVAGYEAAFIQLSDALADGVLNAEQYTILLDDAKNRFLDLAVSAEEAAAAEAQLADERQSWQDQLDVLTGAATQQDVDLRNALAATTDELTQSLINQVFALEASQAAAEEAAAAEQELADLRLSWQDRLDVLTGASTQEQIDLRNALASTEDATTQAIINQVFALEAQQLAADEATRAADELARSWESITNSLLDQVDRIRGNIAESSLDSIAALEAQFAISTAAARAGDNEAASKLVEYSSSLASAYESEASSLAEMMVMQARLAESLDTTASIISTTAPIPPAEMTVIAPNPIDTGQQAQQEMTAAVAELTRQVAELQGRLGEIQTNTRRTADAVNGAGEAPMIVEVEEV